MKWRKVSATEIIAVLEQPDREEKSTGNKINAYRLLNDRFVKVTYKREGSDRHCGCDSYREGPTMKIEYDKEVDALYIRIQEKYVARTQEVAEGVNLDFDADGRLIGLEVVDATKCYSLSDIFNLSTENLILDKS